MFAVIVVAVAVLVATIFAVRAIRASIARRLDREYARAARRFELDEDFIELRSRLS